MTAWGRGTRDSGEPVKDIGEQGDLQVEGTMCVEAQKWDKGSVLITPSERSTSTRAVGL